MANAVNGNTIYVDTGSSDLLVEKKVLMTHAFITATSANAIAVLEDVAPSGGSTTTKLQLDLATSGDTSHFRFEHSPVIFPNGIRVGTLTNCVLTIVFKRLGKV